MTEINMRKKYRAYFSAAFSSPDRPAWDETPDAVGTPRQILDAWHKWRSDYLAGTLTTFKMCGKEGEVYSIKDLFQAVWEADQEIEYRRANR